MTSEADTNNTWRVSDVLKKNSKGWYYHWCPGCDSMHFIAVDTPSSSGYQWKFDGDVDKPTFQPSIHIKIGPYPDNDDAEYGRPKGFVEVCHYFVTAGRIDFLSDCTHHLKGKSVALPSLDIIFGKRGFNP